MNHLKHSEEAIWLLDLDEREVHNLMIDFGVDYVCLLSDNELYNDAMLSTREFWIWWIEIIWQAVDKGLNARIQKDDHGLVFEDAKGSWTIVSPWAFYRSHHLPGTRMPEPDTYVVDASLDLMRKRQKEKSHG